MFVEVSCWEYHITSRPPFFFLNFKGSVHENCEQYLSPLPQPTDGWSYVYFGEVWGARGILRIWCDCDTLKTLKLYMISFFWHLGGGGTSLNCFAKVKVNAQLSQSIKKELQKYEARWAFHEMGGLPCWMFGKEHWRFSISWCNMDKVHSDI